MILVHIAKSKDVVTFSICVSIFNSVVFVKKEIIF